MVYCFSISLSFMLQLYDNRGSHLRRQMPHIYENNMTSLWHFFYVVAK